MEMYSFGKGMGLFFGIVVGLLICLVLFRFMNKDKSLRTKYDERQQIVRGRAYKYGFWTCMATAALIMCLEAGSVVFATRFVTTWIIIFAGILVQVCYSIWNDGYYGVNTNKKRFYAVSLIASLINLLAVIMSIREGNFIVDGVVSDTGVNLLCVILFLVIGIELIIKEGLEKREVAKESGE